MQFLAHSANADGVPQTYAEHIKNVNALSWRYISEALHYASSKVPSSLFLHVMGLASIYHDLGKLDDDNQKVLRARTKVKSRLPYHHADAGAALLKHREESLAALLVCAHHSGLPDWSMVCSLDESTMFRDKDKRTIERTNNELSMLEHRHTAATSGLKLRQAPYAEQSACLAIDYRLLFGCLTDADHMDTAAAETPSLRNVRFPELRVKERLAALRGFIDKNYPKAVSNRDKLRAEFFASCLEISKEESDHPITICDAPVGSGKTTAVMAHLLSQAEHFGLRRIFVVLPFTNIISQSVATYRKALCLEGERAEDVVAEIHHRADFADAQSRQLTPLWKSPIVVTTAVAFFETLASASPATLRRLHNLAGSAIFLDEAHAMLPLKLMPMAWRWIQDLSFSWSCRWVLGSGSLFHFWEWDEFQKITEKELNVPINIVQGRSDLSFRMNSFEKTRICYKTNSKQNMSAQELVAWLQTLEGPVIVVLNTVMTAAYIAHELQKSLGGKSFDEDEKTCSVYHLSTALCPADRDSVVAAVKNRLECNKGISKKWFLIATSCVEAGVDFSFRTGVRERASLLSLLQLAGRVNRNAEKESADVWTITLEDNNPSISKNPAYDIGSRILEEIKNVSADECTWAVKKELRESLSCGGCAQTLIDADNGLEFSKVESGFRVISNDTRTVLVDKVSAEKICQGGPIDWHEVQKHCVNIRVKKFGEYAVQESVVYPGLYIWKLDYTKFLGYMAGVLNVRQAQCNNFLEC